MQITRRTTLGLLAAAVPFAAYASTSEDTDKVVKVTLWDKGKNSMAGLGKEPGMGMGMHGAATSAMGGGGMGATMGIDATPHEVKAGDVTFEVTNTSTDLIHEMVVIPLASPTAAPPYNAAENEIDEDAAGAIGEVSETEPGKTGSVTLRLKPGTYMLVCNVMGHYAMGMWTLLTVTA